MVKRIQARKGKFAKADAQRAAEKPVELLADGITQVCLAGYEWVQEMEHGGPRRSFLAPRGQDHEFLKLDGGDEYLAFATRKITPDGLLSLANRYGTLGVPKEHFHTRPDASKRSESDFAWFSEVSEFQAWFKTWELLRVGNKPSIEAHVRALGCVTELETDGRRVRLDPIKVAKGLLEKHINSHLQPWLSVRAFSVVPCYVTGCSANTRPLPDRASITPHALYGVRCGQNGFTPALKPTALLSAIWLQFAQLVTGERKIVQCEICREWMDVSSAARPNAKRMHSHCSLARRMKTWRRKLPIGTTPR